MSKIKKYIIAAALIIIASLFAGCAEITIFAYIDAYNTMTYRYVVDVDDIDLDDVNYNQVKGYFEKLERHWEKSGYDTDIYPYDDGISIYMEISETYETREEAFAALYDAMTNEISPFTDVDYGYNLNYYYEDYYIDATLNFSEIVDNDIYDVYPGVVGEDVNELLNNIKCTAYFNLPENEGTMDDIIKMNKKSFDISLDSETPINISGKINNNANRVYEENLQAKRSLEQKNMIIFFSITLASIIILVLLIVSKKMKTKTQDTESRDATSDEIEIESVNEEEKE